MHSGISHISAIIFQSPRIVRFVGCVCLQGNRWHGTLESLEVSIVDLTGTKMIVSLAVSGSAFCLGQVQMTDINRYVQTLWHPFGRHLCISTCRLVLFTFYLLIHSLPVNAQSLSYNRRWWFYSYTIKSVCLVSKVRYICVYSAHFIIDT